MPVLQTGLVTPASGFSLSQSLRFNDDDSPYLSRTAGTATSNRIGTFSFWTKRGNLGGGNAFFSNHSAQTDRTMFQFDADTFQMYGKISNSTNVELITTQVFRDPASWYHFVIHVDVTQSTASNRVKIYVNGSQITDFSTATYPAQNTDLPLLSKTNMNVGARFSSSLGDYFDGLLSEFHYVDGSIVPVATLGETSSANGQWIPKNTTGAITYGNNGFHLRFAAGAIGTDSSGNGNNFTLNAITASDVVLDAPGVNRCTLNPLSLVTNTTLSEGNLRADCTSGNDGASFGTMSVSSGKWYWEVLQTTANSTNDISMGVMELSRKQGSQAVGTDVYPNAYLYGNDGWNAKHNSTTSTINSYDAGDIIGWALDLDGNTLKIYKNNSLEYTYSSGVTGTFTPAVAVDGTSGGAVTHIANFGADSSFCGEKTSQGKGDAGDDFYFDPPSDFKALKASNLSPAIADPTAHFTAKTYAGNGSSQTVDTGFAPDLAWVKRRNASGFNIWTDTVRGAGNYLVSNSTDAESSGGSQLVNAFTSSGFTVGTEAAVNASGGTYVGWNWKAGGTASSNTDGTITSSVSANTTAGFSIVSYTGTGANATVGHGLSVAPDLVIVKNRDSTQEWPVGSDVIDSGSWAKYLGLSDSSGESGGASRFNSTAPTSTVVSIGTSDSTNKNTEDHIMYCFHSVDAYSKVGSYTGNANADGPFVHTGFSVEFVMIKKYDGAEDWIILDSARDSYNVVRNGLYADLDNAEGASDKMDFTSNGFKIRSATGVINSSANFLYIAFASSPFAYSTAQ